MLDLVEEIENVFLIAWKNRGDPKLRKHIIKKYKKKWGNLVNTLYMENSWMSVVGYLDDSEFDIDNEITLYTQHIQYEKNMDKIMELLDAKKKSNKEKKEEKKKKKEMEKLKNIYPDKWAAKKGLIKINDQSHSAPYYVYEHTLPSQSPYHQMERKLLFKDKQNIRGPQLTPLDEYKKVFKNPGSMASPGILNATAATTAAAAAIWTPLVPFVIGMGAFGLDKTGSKHLYVISKQKHNKARIAKKKAGYYNPKSLPKTSGTEEEIKQKQKKKWKKYLNKQRKLLNKHKKTLSPEEFKKFANEQITEEIEYLGEDVDFVFDKASLIKRKCNKWIKTYFPLKKSKEQTGGKKSAKKQAYRKFKQDIFQNLKMRGILFRHANNKDFNVTDDAKPGTKEFGTQVCKGLKHRIEFQRWTNLGDFSFDDDDGDGDNRSVLAAKTHNTLTDDIGNSIFSSTTDIEQYKPLYGADPLTYLFKNNKRINIGGILDKIFNAFAGLQKHSNTKDFGKFFFYKDFFNKIMPYLHAISGGNIIHTFVLFCIFVSKNNNFFDLNWNPIFYERIHTTTFYTSKPFFLRFLYSSYGRGYFF